MQENGFIKDKYEFISGPPIFMMDNNIINEPNQVELFVKDLNKYGILIKDLVNYPLKEKERNISLNIAYYLSDDIELSEKIIQNGQINIIKISKITRINTEHLRKWRKYITAYWLILSNDKYKLIQDYIKIQMTSKIPERKKYKKNNNNIKYYTGIIIKKLMNKNVFIITASGEFKKVKLNYEAKLGQVSQGKKKINKKIYKLPLSILVLILIIYGVNIYNTYVKINSIVVIKTTSNIKLHVNAYDRVIYTYSPTQKGQMLLQSIDSENKATDDVIFQVMDYGTKNKMISNDVDVNITVTGQPLKYGNLKKSSKFAIENKISVIINNCGVEQKLLKQDNTKEDETKKEETK